jgi:DNA repair protein RecN (Recombination protein N)
MLEALWIENFLTISHLEIDFERGFTALTGETGAGKSMLMEGLLLALGGRAETSFIRPQANACEISATFHVQPESAAFQWARDHDLDLPAGEWILTRQLNQAGRGKTYLNGKPTPLQLLKSLGEQLVHVHGQHAHYALLQGQAARTHVDRYGAHQVLLAQVDEQYEACQHLQHQLSSLGEMQEVAQRLAYLGFQKDELTQLNLGVNEIEHLSTEHKRLHHVKDYLHLGNELLSKLSAEEHGLEQQLHAVQGILRQLPANEPQVETLQVLLNEASIQIKEAASEAEGWLNSLVSDPERLNQIETRMSELHQAARKYRVDVNALPQVHEKLIQEFTALEAKLEQHPALIEQIKQAQGKYQKIALALREARLKVAPELAAGISVYMKDLGMTHGMMEISFTNTETSERHGLDRLNYEVSTNPGMPPSLLSKVASGGELSRISLAIELMTAERSTTPILLFDEVDVGIGGNTASVVGRLMRQLGERVQVFCVTHQPQVAACAHHHVKIEKRVDNQQVFTQAQLLAQPARVEELARMLGGVNISEQAIRHAEALLEEVN